MKIGLLVVDVQNNFYNRPDNNHSFSKSLEYINYAIGLFKEHGLPIFFIQDEEAGEGPGSSGYQLYEDLNYHDGSIFISKIYSNSFWKTGLESKLRELGTDFVLICGFAAEACINYTYNGALERDFEAAIMQNGIASNDLEFIDFIQKICRIDSIESIEYFLKNLK